MAPRGGDGIVPTMTEREHNHTALNCEGCARLARDVEHRIARALENLAAEAPELTAANLATLAARLLRAGAL